jgi:hypothetical protein
VGCASGDASAVATLTEAHARARLRSYFKPKKHSQRWSDADKLRLQAGLEEFGVGAWDAIIQKHLPTRTAVDVRLQVSRLLGRQDLSGYAGWRGDEAAARAERERNRAEAERRGLWLGGVWVEEEAVRSIREAEAAAAAAAAAATAAAAAATAAADASAEAGDAAASDASP